MLRNAPWLDYSGCLETEYLQLLDEGKDVHPFQARIDEVLAMDATDRNREKAAAALLDEMSRLPDPVTFAYIEPSTLPEIKAERPVFENRWENLPLSKDTLYDKIYGAWLGRCAGCLLGQPVEGWQLERITGLLKETENYPVKDYISSDIDERIRQKYRIIDQGDVYGSGKINWINNVSYMPEDDDTNYTIIGLKLLETYGRDFTPDDVAECWLMNLPLFHLCTAERVAYRNISMMKFPPESAFYRNPYREWIGAQIRADFFGYINPGNPESAAEMAFRDASISHVKNGIYGEMFVAAMLAAAAVTDDIEMIIRCGLSQIPKKSRLTAYINKVLDYKANGLTAEQATMEIHTLFNEKIAHQWCHTISNAMIVCLGLLYGDKDLEKTIGLAMMSAFDTDCNAATVGSVIGMIAGAKQLPEKWILPLNNKIKSGVDGFGLVDISSLAERTLAHI